MWDVSPWANRHPTSHSLEKWESISISLSLSLSPEAARKYGFYLVQFSSSSHFFLAAQCEFFTSGEGTSVHVRNLSSIHTPVVARILSCGLYRSTDIFRGNDLANVFQLSWTRTPDVLIDSRYPWYIPLLQIVTRSTITPLLAVSWLIFLHNYSTCW